MKKITLSLLVPFLLYGENISLKKIKVNATNKDKSIYIQKDSFLKSAPMQKQISTKEALEIAGSNGDPIKALKSFAGIVSTNNDDASEIYIHGSKPRETLYTINHLPIGYIFHLGGLHSIIAPEATGQIDAYLGGYDVSYGSMGAVVDVTPKYPNGSNSGRIHLGMYDADFAYDFKIGENTSLFVGARRSYFDLVAEDIMQELEKDEDDNSKKTTFTLFPQFYDAQLILTHTYENSVFSLEMITAQGQMKLNTTMNKNTDPVANGKINSKVGFTTIGGRWSYTGEDFTSMTLLAFMQTKEDTRLFDADFHVDVKEDIYKIYHESIFDVQNHKPMVGFEIQQIQAPLKAHITNPPSSDDFEPLITDQKIVDLDKTFKANEYTLFAQDIWDINQNNHFRYGLRAYKTDFQEFGGGVDPRVAFVHDFDDSLSASFSVGKYSQLPEIIYAIEGFGNEKIKTNEVSNHYTASIAKRFSDDSSLVVEPYFKTFENLAISDETQNYKSVGDGEAYGIDITYKKKMTDFDMILAYTYVKAKRELNTKDSHLYTFEGDIPHTLQANLNYHFANNWRVSSLFKYSSGKPYTPIVSTQDYEFEGKSYKRPIYAEPYSKRLKDNMDLDLQIGKTIKYANNTSLEYSIELMNLTSLFRKNVADIKYDDEYKKDGYYYQMGFLPSFHINYKF